MMSLVFADWIWSGVLSCSFLVARYCFSYKRVFFCFTMKMDGFEIMIENFHFVELCLQLNFSSFCWWEWGICTLLHSPFRFIRIFYLYLTPCVCALTLL